MSRWLLSALAVLVTTGVALPQTPHDSIAEFKRDVLPFVQKHCYSCHDARKAKAGLRLDELGTDFLAGKTAETWREVIDRINIGDMPPEGSPRPDPKEAFAVVEWVGKELKRAGRLARMSSGRILMRRLNRTEYANTVGDLLRLDSNFVHKIREELPADGKAEGFDRIASALFFDQAQMDGYLTVTEMIAREAVQAAPPETRQNVWEPERFRRGEKEMVPVLQGRTHKIPLGAPAYRKRADGIETWHGRRHNNDKESKWIKVPPGPGVELTSLVTQDGYYRIRVHGGGFPGVRGEPIQLVLIYAGNTPIETTYTIEVKGSLDKPGVAEKLVFLRAGKDGQKTNMAVEWNGLGDVRVMNPALAELSRRHKQSTGKIRQAVQDGDRALADAYQKELNDLLREIDAFTGPEWVHNEKYDFATVPRLYLDRIEVEGPFRGQWPPESHKVLGIEAGLPQTEADVRAMFARLLPLAYRRPVEAEEIDRMVRVVLNARQTHKLSMADALRMGLQTVLCSPGFVFIQEPQPRGVEGVRPLNDHELASRLSYFLWSSMPDEELLALASASKLKDDTVLQAQVKRMLADPRSRRFVEGFAGQWLSIDQFGSVKPAREYRDYDDELEAASREEPLAFFSHILGNNLPITNFLDSDFLVINERLARHYGIEGVSGPEFRPVAIRPEHHRGGVLGMAGLLTLLADGTRTLPVRRAAWVLENLLNDPPAPPPPNAGEIQPNTAGKKLTVRERLALHRSEPTCASCHARLDPYGLALENYDAIGAWRTLQNGEGFRAAKAPAIDPSGRLKSGRSFKDLEGYKSALLNEKEKFAHAFTEKMLTYALCRPVGYVDHPTVDHLTEALMRNDYRIQSLILAIVRSKAFQSK